MKHFIENKALPDEILSLGPNDDWAIFTKEFPKLDIYYAQEYVHLFADVENGVPEAVYYENEDGKVFYPFIKRKIPIKEGYYDIITSYGYGGPVLDGEHHVMKSFYDKFHAYCLKNSIIAETIGLHPLLKNVEYMRNIMRVDYVRTTTAVDLTQSLEEIRNTYTAANKRNIRKAKKEGVKVFVSTNKEDLEIFIDLYYETMDRNKASSFYYFNHSYFYRQMEETELSKSFLLLAEYNGEIIGGVLLIIGKVFAHYHLGASKTSCLSLRPNNLLFDRMIEFSKSFGLKALHLGGGYTDRDSLFTFKTSYTNNNNFNYYLGKKVINEKIYHELSQMIINDYSSADQSDYFPIYRRKS